MNIIDMKLDVQTAVDSNKYQLPENSHIKQWVDLTLPDSHSETEMTIRIVEESEITELNRRYREKESSTNVLSFPFEAPGEIDLPLLGDLVICPAVVEQEAKDQNKSIEDHWAHMVIHGTLHLLGYDHIEPEQAAKMESLEIQLLQKLGISNPYKEITH